jgi:hypothetical protein
MSSSKGTLATPVILVELFRLDFMQILEMSSITRG